MPTRTAFGLRKDFGRRGPRTADITKAAPKPEAAKPNRAVVLAARWPFLSSGLCALLVAVFALEQRYSFENMGQFALGLRDCVALGGSSRYLVVVAQEWWRVFTAPFLHGGLGHLVGNLVTLVLAGAYLERLVGRAWLAALFFVGALAGSIGSLLTNAETTITLGASGAIMCLVTTLFALSHHCEAGKDAARMRWRALAVVIPALLPAAGGAQIDYGAHFGGFVAGITLGFVLLVLWGEDDAAPPLRRFAGLVAFACFVLTAYAFVLMSQAYPGYVAQSRMLVPEALVEKDPAALAGRSRQLVAAYPRDPYARLLQGTNFFNARDFGDAEREARTGLSERTLLAVQFPQARTLQLETLLAASLAAEGRLAEAKDEGAPICASLSDDGYLKSGRDLLAREGVCD